MFFALQELAHGLGELLSYEGNVEEDFYLMFQVERLILSLGWRVRMQGRFEFGNNKVNSSSVTRFFFKFIKAQTSTVMSLNCVFVVILFHYVGCLFTAWYNKLNSTPNGNVDQPQFDHTAD